MPTSTPSASDSCEPAPGDGSNPQAFIALRGAAPARTDVERPVQVASKSARADGYAAVVGYAGVSTDEQI